MKTLLCILSFVVSAASFGSYNEANMRNAIEFGNMGTVKALLAKGVHPNDVTSFYYEGEKHTKSFLRLAEETQHHEIVDLFESYISTGSISSETQKSHDDYQQAAPCWGEDFGCGEGQEDGSIWKLIR